MRRPPRMFLTLVLLAGLLALGPSASAHDDEDFQFGPAGNGGQAERSRNLLPLGNSPETGTVNSDLAFSGRTVVQGDYDGFRLLSIVNPLRPRVLADVDCNGAQGDVSIYGDLVFVSVDAPQTSPECDSADIEDGGPGWEGIRVFDIGNRRRPELITTVATDCGSHTHTLLPREEEGRVLLYVSSYPLGGIGETPYGTQCSTPHSKISVVEVPLDSPEDASVVSEPELPLTDFTIPDIGLTQPGIRGCHDIGVFVELEKAAAACLGEGQIWDISDPEQPQVTARLDDPRIQTWHSGAFTYDGKVAIFGDEHNGAATPGACQDPGDDLGRLWFYDVENPVEPIGSYKIPRPQTAGELCTAHNYNVLPIADRYVLTSAWYQGGTSVVDFTDPANATELAYFDGAGAYWSSYWYNGRIYGSDIIGGLDVFKVIDPTLRRTERLRMLNPQTQEQLLGNG